MVLDIFPFNDELEVLEIRLNVLSPVVDRHILVEAAWTFTGLPKRMEYIRARDSEAFAPFRDKVTVIPLTEPLPGLSAWEREAYQTDRAFEAAVRHAQPDDVLFLGDVDEIPRPEILVPGGIRGISMPVYYGCVNYLTQVVGLRPVALEGRHLIASGSSWAGLRKPVIPWPVVANGGWHFNSLGGRERVLRKLKSFSHAGDAECLRLVHEMEGGREAVDVIWERGELVDVGMAGLPAWVRENAARMGVLGTGRSRP